MSERGEIPETMIQAAARALARADGFSYQECDDTRADYDYRARAALEAAGIPKLLAVVDAARLVMSNYRAGSHNEPHQPDDCLFDDCLFCAVDALVRADNAFVASHTAIP